jgi:hypothetical protein
VRGFIPSAQGASPLTVPQPAPTEPEGANKGPQAPDSAPRPEAATPPETPPTESGHPQAEVLAPRELPAIHVWSDSAANSAGLPGQSPEAVASAAETPPSQPSPTGDQAPDAKDEGGGATDTAPDVGYIVSGIGNALKAIGIEPEKAQDAAAAIALVASLHPAVGVPLALDDLQIAIRRHDIPGILLAAAGLVPGIRAGRGVAKVLRRKRELEALASLQTARRRLVSAKLDRLTAKRDAGKIGAAVRRGSARRINSEVGFNRFRTFKNNLGHAPPGYQWHHIVNYHPTNIRQFGFHALNSSSNLILLPTEVHRKVSAAYSSSKLPGVKGLTLRDWLKLKSFDDQHRHGVRIVNKIMREHYRVPR